jgi:N-methylhydantoinase A
MHRKDYVRTIMLPANEAQQSVALIVQELEAQGYADLLKEGIDVSLISLERFLDLRYLGQSYELPVPLEEQVEDAAIRFHIAHEQRFGYSDARRQVQVVNVRVRACGQVQCPSLISQQEQEIGSGFPVGN